MVASGAVAIVLMLVLFPLGSSGWRLDAHRAHESGVGETPTNNPSTPPEWKAVNFFVGTHEALGKSGETHSQVGQDWLAATLLDCKRNGFFVDLAANDAEKLSNSLMLERDFGWNGICVEANVQYMYGLSHRQCKVVSGAVGSPRNKPVTFSMRPHGDGVYSGMVGTGFDNELVGDGQPVNLRTVPLADILAEMDAPSVIDYFSLDIEGAERVAMQDFPWDKYRFLVITVERPKHDLVENLKAHGYTFVRKNSEFDDETWISTALPNFEKVMASWPQQQPGMKAAAAESCMTAKGYATPNFGGPAGWWAPKPLGPN